jgi:hypothetical protein
MPSICSNDRIRSAVVGACSHDRSLATQEHNALRRIAERGAWLGCTGRGVPGTIRFAMQCRVGSEMWALATPYAPCPWSLEKQPSAAVSHSKNTRQQPGV